MIGPHVVPPPPWMTARAVSPKSEDAEVAAASASAGPITVQGIKLEVQEEFRAEFGMYEEVARAVASRAEVARMFRNPLFSEDVQGATVKAEVQDEGGGEILLGGGIAREALVQGLLVCRAESDESPEREQPPDSGCSGSSGIHAAEVQRLESGLLVYRAAPSASAGPLWSLANRKAQVEPEKQPEPEGQPETPDRAWTPPTPTESDGENRSPTPPLPIHNP